MRGGGMGVYSSFACRSGSKNIGHHASSGGWSFALFKAILDSQFLFPTFPSVANGGRGGDVFCIHVFNAIGLDGC